MKKTVLLITVVLLLLCGCANSPAVTTTKPEPYFPVQTEDPGIYMLALLPGNLIMDKDGYLRVNDALVLWPYEYSVQREGEDIWVLNDKGEKQVRVGDHVSLGGGYIPDNVVPDKIGYTLPEGCKGPFFLASPMTK